MPYEYSLAPHAAPVSRTTAANHRLSERTERNALRPYPLFLAGILLLASMITAAGAATMSGNTVTVTNAVDAAALVYVSGYDITPAVFYPGETGTVTVHVTNAANTSVTVSQPNLMEPHLHINNLGSFTTATQLGPGQTYDFNFVVTAEGSDGTYFPLFTVSPSDIWQESAIHSTLKFKIDSTEIRGSIATKPDNFALNTKDMVNVSIVNPRTGDIANVMVVPESDGAQISPQESFVGTVRAGSSVQVPFAITPDKAATVTFHISYYNGDNKRTFDVPLTLNIADNKQGAQIVVNNIESTDSGGTTTLKGDVTNNGLTAAKSVLVTVGNPAKPIDPNPQYAIGNLNPDDFSSFEVTYTKAGPGAVPIIVQFKDADGNVFTQQVQTDGNNASAYGSGSQGGAPGSSGGSAFNRRGGGGMFGSFGSGLNQVPVIPIAAILVLIVALLVAWRKGILKPVIDRFHRKQDDDDEDLKEN